MLSTQINNSQNFKARIKMDKSKLPKIATAAGLGTTVASYYSAFTEGDVVNNMLPESIKLDDLEKHQVADMSLLLGAIGGFVPTVLGCGKLMNMTAGAISTSSQFVADTLSDEKTDGKTDKKTNGKTDKKLPS